MTERRDQQEMTERGPAGMTEAKLAGMTEEKLAGMTEEKLAGMTEGPGGSVVPDTPLLSFPTFLPLLSFPTFLIGNPGVFPMQGHMNEKGQKKNTGFPLKTCGNDREERPFCRSRRFPPFRRSRRF